jgi:hypothetical protein
MLATSKPPPSETSHVYREVDVAETALDEDLGDPPVV